jgi:hypothetical protein
MKAKYSQEQLDIAILQNQHEAMQKSLDRIEKNMKEGFDKIDSNINSHFKWTLGMILGLYAVALSTLIGAVGHAYHWF